MLLFADLEMSANAAVLNQLANVMVIIGGQTVTGIFRRPATVVNLGAGAAETSPTLTLASSAVMDDPVDQLVVIAGATYTILAAQPDGTGLTVLTVGAYQ